jgi:hypothetical protein
VLQPIDKSCDKCGVEWRFSALNHRPNCEDLATAARRIEAGYPFLCFVGIVRGKLSPKGELVVFESCLPVNRG